MSETMLAVVKPEAAPGADVRQMPVPQIGPIYITGTSGPRTASSRRSFRDTSFADM